MSLARNVLGRPDARRARSGLVYGIAAARLTLEVQLELRVRAAAVAFEAPVSHRLSELIAGIVDDIGATADLRTDSFGLIWVTLSGAGLDDLALAIGVVAGSLERAGWSEQVVCAAVAFERSNLDALVYLIYNFTRARFYAFVPRDGGRDAREERRMEAALARDLPLEPDPQRRYPLSSIPV